MLHRAKHRDVDTSASQNASTGERRRSGVSSLRRRSSAIRFFASGSPPKQDTHAPSQKQWEADYLKNLRTNRPPRPGGSRPLPERHTATTPEPFARAASAMSVRPTGSTQRADASRSTMPDRAASALSHRIVQPAVPRIDRTTNPDGRPLVRAPDRRGTTRDFSATTTSTNASSSSNAPALVYRESGLRWAEKQEARSLREALEDMDLREEAKVHAAAQNEASELVWKHANEGLPYRHAEPHRYSIEHLAEGAHAPNGSRDWSNLPIKLDGMGPYCQLSGSKHSVSMASDDRRSDNIAVSSASSSAPEQGVGDTQGHRLRTHIKWDSPGKKAYTDLAFQMPATKSTRHYTNGSRARTPSGGPFRNPNDRIYEEKDDRRDARASSSGASKIPAPLTPKARNSIASVQNTTQPSLPPLRVSNERSSKNHRSDIHNKPPSQSRDPSYLENKLPTFSFETTETQISPEAGDRPRTKDGIEIRSDDIRAATSMRMKDRSPKLPSPTIVSDRPCRPIVSFDEDWKPKDADKQYLGGSQKSPFGPDKVRFKPRMPTSTASAPVIPTINVPDVPPISVDSPTNDTAVPSISVSQDTIPTISIPDDDPAPRALPTISVDSRANPVNRPLPHHSKTAPIHTSIPHWTPISQRATAQCAACALPISGRIVSAASQRFHPHCFTCHYCAEPLECVAFYPEPNDRRAERLARIQARLEGSDLPDNKPGETAAEDGDDSLRFYCHLDYHELFSPRCRSCKTPIETEVIIACGGSWHVGHFFCAECGDPFDAKTPFVEKDGYAWCVECHAGRFSGKCRGCRKPVVESGVNALGAEWHENCFTCMVSN